MNKLLKHARGGGWVVMVSLLVLWGFGIFNVGNRAIHLLLVLALIICIVQLVSPRTR